MTTVTPYYEADGITIYHGDSRDIISELEFDVVVTDPPYGAKKAAWDFALPDLQFLTNASALAVMPGVMNLGKMPAAIGDIPYRWTLAIRFPNSSRSPFGLCHWIPCVIYADSNVKLDRGAVDFFSSTPRHDQSPYHPTPKPLDATTWVVGLMPSGIILDPFMGSGTTLRAAKNLGRQAIGIEIEERYCEIAARRLAQGVLDFGTAS